jgi:hypothetical protein
VWLHDDADPDERRDDRAEDPGRVLGAEDAVRARSSCWPFVGELA